ncbi:hypothetical protein CHS0354_003731 [Potamilus streckersoni]|uniref:Receptor protein-tyrosine kinase n=1 Tax=Potamilus streckersoni TaxID=2493646 RepID=A0AAE0VYP1_9BIVA|nr:hypothetical protein CHS0354_003731 [Potamilus streckersoni]
MDILLDRYTVVLYVLFYGLWLCHCQDTFYFSQKPQDQDVIDGSEAILYCDVSNRRHITFQWIFNKKPFDNTSRRFQDGSNLRILRVTREEDSGQFQCIATNVTTGFSLQSNEAVLNIQWIEKEAKVELKKPDPPDVTLGVDILLKCQITGNPEPLFHWYQNHFRIFNTDNVKIVDKGTRLKLSSVSAKDNGVYSCRAENVAGAVDSTSNFILNVAVPNTPHLIREKFTPHQLVLKGDSARLDCPFVNATRIDWFSNYEKLSNSSRHTIYENGSLYFPRVRQSDEGIYRCEGLPVNRDIPAQTFTAELVLAYLYDFALDSFEPRLIPNFPLVIPVHSKFVVKAFPPDGKPVSSYRWLDKNDMTVRESGVIHTDNSHLVFENPQEIDSGNYTFVINNSAGEKRQNVWIIVSVPPIVRRGPQARDAREGHSAEFSCHVTGTAYPVTTILWMKDDEYIKLGSPRHKMNMVTGILLINNVTQEDLGYYSCVANTTGQNLVISSKAFLHVKKQLKFNPLPKNAFIELNSDAEISCFAEAEFRPNVYWRKDGAASFDSNVIARQNTLYFRHIQRSDAGFYTCYANSPGEEEINVTIYVDVVEPPSFQIKPLNTTVYEGQTVMLHCLALGDPKPSIIWDKNYFADGWDLSRFKFLPNGTMLIARVYMMDRGRYGCTANNSAGSIRAMAYLQVTSTSEYVKDQEEGEEEDVNMMRTIIIAVCSAGAYFALVIGLTAFFSYKLIKKRNRKSGKHCKSPNGNLSQEQHELLMKDHDRDSGGTQFRSDSDNRSHASGLSSHPSHSSHSQGQSQVLSQAHSQRSRKGSIDRVFFPRHELQTLGMLGKGQFGDVFLAKARGIRTGELETLVLVKSILVKDDHLFYEFRQEMEMYSKLEHPNVVKLLGVCREMDLQFIIYEHCDWGDLKQFLLASRTDNGRRIPARVPPLTAVQKVGMCNQVALGLEHLSNHRFVHKDIATRNILLTSRLELKVSSISLCRDIYAGEYIPYNNTMIPLRWLSPEAVLEDDYSTKSDVWSYGVFVWEVFHLGDFPHKNRTDDEILKGLKVGDVTLEISEQCPNEIIDLIQKCTTENPRDRPLFSEICVVLGEILTMLSTVSYPVTAPSVASNPSVVSHPS